MKIVLSCAIALSWLGCSDLAQPGAREVFVKFDVEFQFENDPVQLQVDDEMFLNERVTTNPVLSLAWSSGLRKLSAGDHSMRFTVVEFGAQRQFTVHAEDDTSSVLIKFDRSSSQIVMSQMKGVFMRD